MMPNNLWIKCLFDNRKCDKVNKSYQELSSPKIMSYIHPASNDFLRGILAAAQASNVVHIGC